MRSLLVVSFLVIAVIAEDKTPVRGTKCAPNQVVNRITVYEDGAIEAECGPLPCGTSGARCSDGGVACRGDTDIFSGMSWAANGQSVLLRCCSLNVPKKIYVGTDLVTAGSYYIGGAISEKDKYGNGGSEYDFVTNIRTEQGGVRVWVYRVMCDQATAPKTAPVPQQLQQPVQQQQQPVPSFQPAAAVPPPPAPKATAASNQEAFENRRKYLLERLSGRQQTAQSVQEEQGEDEEEYEDDEEVEEKPRASTFNPLRYRPSVRGAPRA